MDEIKNYGSTNVTILVIIIQHFAKVKDYSYQEFLKFYQDVNDILNDYNLNPNETSGD